MTEEPLTEGEKEEIRNFIRDIQQQEPTLKKEGLDHFDGYFAHWDEIIKCCQQAWPKPHTYAESPLELIAEIIDERDALKKENAAFRLGHDAKNEEIQRLKSVIRQDRAFIETTVSDRCKAEMERIDNALA